MADNFQTTASNDDTGPLHTLLDSAKTSDAASQPLTTKNAVEYLLNGTLRKNVCRYCLNVTSELLELDTVLHVGGQRALYQITIKDIIANVYPFQVTKDPDLPNKICNRCLNRSLSSYLFVQQCEQAERALRNCLEDIGDKVDKLDPLERKNKRGRHKSNPNHDKIYSEHEKVIDYAEPIMHLVNQGSALFISEKTPTVNDLVCPKCWQVLPNTESLVNHEKIHPKSMWYHCRQCGKSFAKHLHLRKHIKSEHDTLEKKVITVPYNKTFECKTCGYTSENHQLFLTHIEKHKFKKVLGHILAEKTDTLCTICLNKGTKMLDLETQMALSGSCPELHGDKSLYHIVGSTLPDMNYSFNYTGTRICQNCTDKAISSYLFINQTLYTRCRLHICISTMLETLTKMEEPTKNVVIELSETLIVPLNGVELSMEDLFDDEFDETQLNVEVLEDKYRIKSSSESEDERQTDNFKRVKDVKADSYEAEFNKFIHVNKKRKIPVRNYSNRKLQNGFHSNKNNSFDNVSEFLTFRKKEEPKKAIEKTKYHCDLCSKSFISVHFLKNHILKHINKSVECMICNLQFESKFHLHEHTKLAHLLYESNTITCDICSRTFTDLEKMKRHRKSHSKRQCSVCDKFFKSQKHYNVHLQRHVAKYKIINRKQRQTCSFCESECLNKNQLAVHVNKVHLQIKPYACDMCEKKFYTKYNLANHKKLHNVKTREKCEFCGVNLTSRKDLVIHVRKHMGSKPHSCLLCAESFYSQGEKNMHMKKTHGGKLICNVCKTVFADKSELKVHTRNFHISQF